MKIVLRLGSDVTIKSDKVRAKFVGRLVCNLRAAFQAHGIEARIDRQWSKLFVETDDPRAPDVLARVYGVCQLAVIEHECEATMPAIIRTAVAGYATLVAGKTFAIRARRIGTHTYTSMDVQVEVGSALHPFANGVDLAHPEVEIGIEIREGQALLFSKQVRGPAGLPLGVSGKVLGLFSGGFDSAVAAWLLQKRGVEVELLFFNLAGSAYERSVVALAKHFTSQWSYGTRPKIHVVDFQPVAAAIKTQVKGAFAQVVLKRCFYRAATQLARYINAPAILTGEAIGQVSSQTLPNLCAIEAVTPLPVIRPLIGWDKDEITKTARRIGTFELSSKVQEYCQLVQDRPVTSTRDARVALEEKGLDMTLVSEAVDRRRTLHLNELAPADLVLPYVFTETVPDGAVVIDCRPEDEYRAWHWPGAINVEPHELTARMRKFDKKAPHVLYCPIGLQSAAAAETMQKAGFEAYSLKGGVRALRSSE